MILNDIKNIIDDVLFYKKLKELLIKECYYDIKAYLKLGKTLRYFLVWHWGL